MHVAPSPLPKIVVIVGPTGTGKSDLAVALAERFSGEIVNLDSMQLFTGLDIGTAKPSTALRQRVPHHLYELLAPGALMNAADYAQQATAVITELHRRGRLPLLVGGTGFYLRALLQGLVSLPAIPETILSEIDKLESEKGLTYLHELLKEVDAPVAARLPVGDGARIRRALAVWRATGEPLSAHQARHARQQQGAAPRWQVLQLGLEMERPQLYERLNRRAARMFESGGILSEARLFAAGAARGIGYEEAAQVNAGTMTVSAAIAATAQRTRHYAKRQFTWFRRLPELAWLEVRDGGEAALVAEASAMIEQFLAGES